MISNQKGFTLIELLISVSILSSLLFTGTYTYQILAERWGKEVGQFDQSSNTVKNFALINSILNGIKPFVVKSGYNRDVPAFFFVGHDDRLLSVTVSGLFGDRGIEIFRLITQKNENGLFDLIYQSTELNDLLLLTTEQEIVFDHKVLLLNNLTDIKFEYLGWDNYKSYAEIGNTLEQPKWRRSYSGIDSLLLPIEMKLIAKQEEKEIEINIELDRKTLRYLTPYFSAE